MVVSWLFILFPIQQFRLPIRRRSKLSNEIWLQNDSKTNRTGIKIVKCIFYGRDSDARWLRSQNIYHCIYGGFFPPVDRLITTLCSIKGPPRSHVYGSVVGRWPLSSVTVVRHLFRHLIGRPTTPATATTTTGAIQVVVLRRQSPCAYVGGCRR